MGKNNYHLKNIKEGTKVESYSIKKFKVGAASVVIGASIFFGAGAVAQASESVSNNTVTDESLGTEKKLEVAPKAQAKPVIENTRESLSAALASKLENSEKETLNKVALTKLIEEIDGKFTNGKYASKTEESVNQLKTALEEARTVLNNAETQAELSQAQAKLVTATTKLQTKPEDKKEAPAVDTTNGKDTVGIKATNTEKAKESNSIANSGSRDERNGKALDKNNPFRTDTNPSTTVSADPLAVNETPKKLINQYFDEGVEKATGNEKLKLQPATNLTGWKFENPNQDKIIIANGRQTYYGSQMFPDANHTQGIVLGGFTGIRSGNKYDKMGPIYQDIDVVPNSELVLRMRGATFGTQGGPSTYKMEVFDVNNLTTPLGKIESIRARPAEFNGLVNIPEGVTKVRIRLSDTNEVQRGIGDSRDPYVEIDGTKVYTGGIVANFSASSGSYIVPSVGRSNYTAVSEASNQATVETTITVNLENKGGAASRNTTYSVQLPEGANIVSESVKAISASGRETKISPNISNGLLSINVGSVPGEEITKINYTLQLPANKPLSKDLNGVVTYETNNFPILNPSIPRKRGEQRVEPQNVTVAMFKGELEAEVAKSNNLDENNYTPESWKEYQDELVKAKAILNEETNNVSAENRKNQAEINAQLLLVKQARVKLGTEELEKAKNELKVLAAVEHLTDGKTPETATAYNDTVKLANDAIAAAEKVIQSSDPTPKQVKDALASVNEAKAALANAKAALITAATQEQKDKLATDLATLEKAVTDGKTPGSVEEYNRKFNELSEELTDAKEAAKSVAEKGENASEIEVFRAQDKVNSIKAKLTEAAALLKDLANKDALTQAKKALEDLKGEETPTGKTTDSLTAYTQAKDAATEELGKAKAVIDDQNATPERVAEALAEVNEKKAALEAAKAALVDKITQDQKDDLTNAEENLKLADTTGKTKDSIKAYNDEVAKLSDELEVAKQVAKDLVDKGDNAGELEAYRVQAKINKLKSKLAEAAKLLKDIDKSVAKKEVEEAAKKATDVIVANNDLTSEQKAAAKAKVAEEATKAIDAIDKAKSEDDIKAATDAGKLAIEKEAAKAEIEAAKAAKEKAIEANDKLSDAEKQAAKEEAAKAADEAKKAIDAATDNAGVAGAKTTGTAAVEAVNPIGKDKAKAEIEKELAEKTKAIDTNADLTPDQKAEAKAKIAEEAKKAIDAIDKATTTEEVASAKESGKLAIEKEAAKAEIEAAKAAKEKAIDARTDLTAEEKATAKARVEEEAEAAKNAIDKATDLSDLDKVTETGKDDIKRVTVTSAKEEAKKAIDEALAAKEKAIDARTDLTDEEKAAAKKAAREEAEAAKNAIDKATTSEDINKVLEDGKANIAKINPVGAKEETTVKTSDVDKSDATEKSSNKVSNKQLPNTGTTETNTGLVGLGLGILGLLAAARRRKEK